MTCEELKHLTTTRRVTDCTNAEIAAFVKHVNTCAECYDTWNSMLPPHSDHPIVRAALVAIVSARHPELVQKVMQVARDPESRAVLNEAYARPSN